MIYIVSGSARSGTSMMAECLKQGGISLVYQKGLSNSDVDDDFEHNSVPLWQQPELIASPALCAKLDGKVVKIMPTNLMALPTVVVPNVKVIWMERDSKCTVRSFEKALRSRGVIGDVMTPRVHKMYLKHQRKRLERRGINLLRVRYEKCVKRPFRAMLRISEFLNCPSFNAEKAAAVIDPEKWRQR